MPKGAYTGRLSWDPDLLMHTDLEDNPVVTEDGGKSWRYAEDGDANHFERYHQQFAEVDTTANKLAELQLEHGREAAEEMMRAEHPHHYEVQPDDPHFARVMNHPDKTAPKMTGHTDAWSE